MLKGDVISGLIGDENRELAKDLHIYVFSNS